MYCAVVRSAGLFLIALKPMTIPTGAMENTLLIGDHVLVINAPGVSPSRLDIVVFRYPIDPRQIYVKRVVGIPGDNIRIAGKKLFVSGVAQEEPYVFHGTNYMDSYRDNSPSKPNMRL
jgi:signal peptidase I